MTERTNKLKEQLGRVNQQRDAPAASTTTPPATVEPSSPEPRRRPRTAGGRKPAAGESWEDRVKRATFYVDRALLAELEAFLETRPDINKSEFVREAITRHLQTYR